MGFNVRAGTKSDANWQSHISSLSCPPIDFHLIDFWAIFSTGKNQTNEFSPSRDVSCHESAQKNARRQKTRNCCKVKRLIVIIGLTVDGRWRRGKSVDWNESQQAMTRHYESYLSEYLFINCANSVAFQTCRTATNWSRKLEWWLEGRHNWRFWLTRRFDCLQIV